MGYESIAVAYAGKSRSKWNGGGRHGVFIFPQRDNNQPKLHMTQKPIKLMHELINLFTNEGETVLDPFMGSGTTGVACKNMDRKFIGIEINEKFFSIACKRIEDNYRQMDIFKSPQKQKQETFL